MYPINMKLLLKVLTIGLMIISSVESSEYTAKVYIENIKFKGVEEPPVTEPETPINGFSMNSLLNLNSSNILNLNNQSSETVHITVDSIMDFANVLTSSNCASLSFKN